MFKVHKDNRNTGTKSHLLNPLIVSLDCIHMPQIINIESKINHFIAFGLIVYI